MFLKSLGVYGFKSFPERTTLKFEPGVTVVVGPNGCGKSNVFDAIKWALGEQSPKSLRGSKMEDVIFNGTEHHSPLSYSEVTLTFSNEDHYLPIDYKEVAVTRKLYRSGESEYYLNKNQVRLKDLQNLFLGTGIGESTYSFVEQGKIEVFLSYKPEEKRLIFDEASGIVKYKERKKEALKKLNETEQNLLRLEDIIVEVQRQTRYLERQVAKTRKYKEIKSVLVDVERKIATIQIEEVDKKIDCSLEQLNGLKKEEEKQASELASFKAKDGEYNKEIQEIRNTLDEVTSQIISLNSKLELYENTIAINGQRIEERRMRIANIDSEQEELTRKVSFREQRLCQEKELCAALDEDMNRSIPEIEMLRKNKEQMSKEIKDLHREIEENKKEILFKEVEKANFNNEFVEAQERLRSLFARKKRLTLDKEKLGVFFKEREQSLTQVEDQAKILEKEFAQLKREKMHIEQELKVHAQMRHSLDKERVEEEKRLAELRAYYEFLKDLRIKYGGFSSTKKVKVIFDEIPTKLNKLIISLKDVNITPTQLGGQACYMAEVEAKVVLFEESELQDTISKSTAHIGELSKKEQEEEVTEKGLREEAEKIQQTISEYDKKLGAKLQEKESLTQEFLRVKDEFELLQEEIDENIGQIQVAEEKKKNIEENFKQAEAALSAIRNSLEENQAREGTLGQQLQSIEIEITKKEMELNALNDKKDALLRRILMSEEDKNSFIRTKERLFKEREENSEKIALHVHENESLREEIEQKKTMIEKHTEEKEKLKEDEDAIAAEREKIVAQIDEAENILEEIKKALYEKKLHIQEQEFEKSKIIDYLHQVYQIEFVPQHDMLKEHYEECVQERDKLKKKLDSLGDVNLVAIEEFEELNTRYNFLDGQKSDLVRSKDELKKAIHKINRTSRQIFLEVFTKIREEFKKNFRFLFGGGRAELVLLDEENVLESGVEIEVQPPGKKLQNVSLLSGGEKALAAIALIFAIFKIKPSPLCVLDEIDAPLDEVNVDRFNQVLRNFAHQSQFVVITHNKKTMGMADVLYGVTMQEKGVSKIVSVKFAEESVG